MKPRRPQPRPDSPPTCGEGLGVGGTPNSDVLQSPHPVSPPQEGTREEGTLRPAPRLNWDRQSASGARHWAPLARYIEAEARIGAWAERRTATLVLYEFVRFGIKQGWACLFGAIMLVLLIGTHFLYPRAASLTRYDFLFLAAVAIQIAMLAFRLETWEEATVFLV